MISTWLASGYTEGSGSSTGRIALIAVAVLAVAAYVMLQLRTRSRRQAACSATSPQILPSRSPVTRAAC